MFNAHKVSKDVPIKFVLPFLSFFSRSLVSWISTYDANMWVVLGLHVGLNLCTHYMPGWLAVPTVFKHMLKDLISSVA